MVRDGGSGGESLGLGPWSVIKLEESGLMVNHG